MAKMNSENGSAGESTPWLGKSPGNEFVKKIQVTAYDSDIWSSLGKRSFGFGWATGVDLEGKPLGGAEQAGLFTKLIGRVRRQGPTNVLAIRSMDMLFEQGVIPPQGARSYAQWMHDAGVAFHVAGRMDTVAMGTLYDRMVAGDRDDI